MNSKKSKELEWPDDPVVEEVRTVRSQLWKAGGGTVAGFLELVRKCTAGQKMSKKKSVQRQRLSKKVRKAQKE